MVKLKAGYLRDMTPEERKEMLVDAQKELMAMRGQEATGHVIPQIRDTRKEIARIKTVMREMGDKM